MYADVIYAGKTDCLIYKTSLTNHFPLQSNRLFHSPVALERAKPVITHTHILRITKRDRILQS